MPNNLKSVSTFYIVDFDLPFSLFCRGGDCGFNLKSRIVNLKFI
nr:MAG TPA: hypothetical protein [Caudoviricetes sp.]